MQRGKGKAECIRFRALRLYLKFVLPFSVFKHALSLKVNIGFPLANKG